jgi:DNA-binding response OmpR family regulator
MVKPFKQPEILARIQAHLRRRQPASERQQKHQFGDGALSIDLSAHVVKLEGREVELTPREFELLATLVDNAGRVIPTPDLVWKAWGLKDESALDNIKPYIHYLRKKIELDPASPRWIKTVRGVGYRFADE